MRSLAHDARMPAGSRAVALTAAFALVPLIAVTAPAADSSPQGLAFFTKKVQPLILNKCAAGACHGGSAAHEPRFHRGDVSGWVDRADTLANMESLTDAVGAHGDLSAFLATISRRHPAAATGGGLKLSPLTAQERTALEQWLAATVGKAARAEPSATSVAGRIATTPAATHSTPAQTPRPNRFRAMLEAAANPLPLPPPQEPQGIILGRDRGE